MEKGDIFHKKALHGWTNFGDKIYGGFVLHRRTNDQIMLRGEEFHKMHFLVI